MINLAAFYEEQANAITIDEKLIEELIQYISDVADILEFGPLKVEEYKLLHVRNFTNQILKNHPVRNKYTYLYRFHYGKAFVHINPTTNIKAVKFIVTATEQQIEKPKPHKIIAYTSIIDNLPLRWDPKTKKNIKTQLKTIYTEEELRVIINRFKQKNPGSDDMDIAKYLMLLLKHPPKGHESILDGLSLNDAEKQVIVQSLSPHEINEVIAIWRESFQGKNHPIQFLFKNAILRNKRRVPVSKQILDNKTKLINSLAIDKEDKYTLDNKFSYVEIIDIVEAYKKRTGNEQPTILNLSDLFQIVLDDYVAMNIRFILTKVGTADWPKIHEELDHQSYLNPGKDINFTDDERLPPHLLKEEPDFYKEEKTLIETPRDLYKGFINFITSGRLYINARAYETWYLSEGIANYFAFEVYKAHPFKNEFQQPFTLLPSILTYDNLKAPILISPWYIAAILETFPEAAIKRVTSNTKYLLDIKRVSHRLQRVFGEKGAYAVILHHEGTNKHVHPISAVEAKPQSANITIPTGVPSRQVIEYLDNYMRV